MKQHSTEVEQGNKLIAEFMGAVYDGRKYWKFPDGSLKIHAPEYDSQLKYHSSWDWLMPVVEKIETLGHSTNIDSDIRETINDKYFCGILYVDTIGTYIVQIYSRTSKIEAVWLAVIEFINWYNKNKKQIE